jgi:glutaredoxin 3
MSLFNKRTPQASNKGVVIYTADYCSYCRRAIDILKDKGVQFREIDVTHDSSMREKLIGMTGGRDTVPQIFVDGKSIGGCDELESLYANGATLGYEA